MNIETVNELIASLESAGELSIKELKYLELGKAYVDREAEGVAQVLTFEKCREIVGCPAGVDLQDHLRQLAAENVGLKGLLNKIAFTYSLSPHIHEMTTLQTPATDRIVAGIKADGVEVAIKEFFSANTIEASSMKNVLQSFAQQLREGAK